MEQSMVLGNNKEWENDRVAGQLEPFCTAVVAHLDMTLLTHVS